MSDPNLRNITNNFLDVRLLSLASWRRANEILPHDRGGPYVITQEGYDPEDMTMKADEFILGRSGKWLSLGYFFRMPIAERRAEFVFGTAAEIMLMMYDLPPKVVMFREYDEPQGPSGMPDDDEMAAAFKAAANQSPAGKAS